MTTLGNFVFHNCSSLESATISNSETQIGYYAFIDCADTLVIYGYTGSTAETYANENEITFVALDKEPEQETDLGDVDGDGEVTVLDATSIQKYLTGKNQLLEEAMKAADTDKDGIVAVMDATKIQRFIAKIITEF